MSPTVDNDLHVVVAATRGWAQDPLDIPQAVSVISSGTLNETVYSSLENVLHRLPNVGLAQASQPYSTAQSGSTSSNYWQEGFNIRGLGGPRVLVLTDGVRQAGQGIGYGGGNLSLYDIYAIERVEVLRGPFSVMYGTDAFGGVISITTKEPTRRNELGQKTKARLSFDGSRNMWRRSGYIDFGAKNFSCVVGASDTIAKTPRAAKGATMDGGAFNSYGGWLKSDYFLTPKTRLRFMANSTQVQDIQVADRTLNDTRVPVPFDFKIKIPLYSRSEIGLEWTGTDLSENLEDIKVGFFWQGLHRHFHWDGPQFKKGREDRSVRVTNDNTNTFELQPMARFHFNQHTLIAGADIAYDEVKLQDQRVQTIFRYFPGTTADPLNPIGKEVERESFTVAEAHQYRLGAYAQDRWDLHPFEIVAGGRFDVFYINDEKTNKKSNPSGLSGSASSIYHWDDETAFYFTLGAGFRAPDLGERFQKTTVVFAHPIEVLGNPDLKPEHSYSAEIGSKHRGDNWSFEIATFVNQVDNYIGHKILDRTHLHIENLGRVLLYGFEGQASFFPVSEWALYLGTGRTYTENSSKIALPGWIFNFGTAYTKKVSGSFLSYIKPELRGTAATSSFDSLNAVHYPGFCAFDVQVTFGLDFFKTSIIEGSLIVGIKNVFDKRYYMPFFGDPEKNFNAQPGRGIFTALELAF